MINVISKNKQKISNSRLLCSKKQPQSSDWQSLLETISLVKRETPRLQWANDNITIYFYEEDLTIQVAREVIGFHNLNNSQHGDSLVFIDQDAFIVESLVLDSQSLEMSFEEISTFAANFKDKMPLNYENGASWRLRLTSEYLENDELSYLIALEFPIKN